MELWAVVVAAGSGSRFGGPKQLARLGGRSLIDWSVAAMSRVCDGVVVVGPDALGGAADLGVADRVEGGATRSDSVRAGLRALNALAPSADHVLVHDAARPLVPAAVVDRVVAALVDGADAVVPVVAVTDTLRTVDGRAVDRDGYVAVQTPQGFRVAILAAAHAGGSVATDDATVVESMGHRVVHVEGDPINMKVTFPHDLVVAEQLLEHR